MDTIVRCDNCGGQKIKIKVIDGTVYHRFTSKLFRGTLVLEADSEGLRVLRFVNPNAPIMGKQFYDTLKFYLSPSPKRFFSMAKDYLTDQYCVFGFSEDFLKKGHYRIEYQIQVGSNGSAVFGLACYNFVRNFGRMYMFPLAEDANSFANAIGLQEAILLDDEGTEKKRIPCSEYMKLSSDLPTLLLLRTQVYS